MREIKFRAWDTKLKCMSMVTLMDFTEWWVRDEHSGERNSFKNEETDRHILMQFTGLKDKNGKEIYEGDIVKTFAKWISEICFGPFQSHMSGELNIGFYCKNANGTTRPMSTISSEYEIIGNVHQNPELRANGETNQNEMSI